MAGKTAGLASSASGRSGDRCIFGSWHSRPCPVRRVAAADAAPPTRSTILQERSKTAKAQKDDASSIPLPESSAEDEQSSPSSNPVNGQVDKDLY